MQQQLTPEAEKAIRLATALFETKGCTEAEASSRTAKAMELLAAHNLDMAVIGSSAKGAQRSDKTKQGGLYQWQRDLWKATAQLNFCVYFSKKGLTKGSVYEHRIVGRHENVVVAELMAEYLQKTVERITQDHARANGVNVFCRDMIAYREGMAERLVYRLGVLRRERIEEDKARQAEARASQVHTPSTASTPGTALALVDVINSEADLNTDYLNGLEPGTTGALRAASIARQAVYAEKHRLWEEDKAEFARRWPEDVKALTENDEWTVRYHERQAAEAEQRRIKAEKAEQRKQTMIRNGTYKEPEQIGYDDRTYRERPKTPQEQRRALDSFWHGSERGKDVGIDTQVESNKQERLG